VIEATYIRTASLRRARGAGHLFLQKVLTFTLSGLTIGSCGGKYSFLSDLLFYYGCASRRRIAFSQELRSVNFTASTLETRESRRRSTRGEVNLPATSQLVTRSSGHTSVSSHSQLVTSEHIGLTKPPIVIFWATVCKTVRPMLSVRCLSCEQVIKFCCPSGSLITDPDPDRGTGMTCLGGGMHDCASASNSVCIYA